MAEQDGWDEPPEELVPQTPPRRNATALSRTTSGVVADRDTALAEFADFDVHMLDSSPLKSPERPIRTEASTYRPPPQPPTSSPVGGPAPSQQQPRIVPPSSTVKNIEKCKWDKEVEFRLREQFKLSSFRHNQREAINETMAGNDGESNPIVHSDSQCLFLCLQVAARV